MQCTVCGLWAHKTCSGVTDEIFTLIDLQKKATGKSYWACRPCTVYPEGMNHRMRQIEEKIERVEKATEENAANVKEIEQKVQSLSEEVKKQRSGADKLAQNCENGIFEELRDRESRKLNIVIHRVGECPNEKASIQERIEWDLESCVNMFKAMQLQFGKETIKFVRRVGEKKESNRPLVVGLTTDEGRRKILDNARELKNTFFKEISIVPDLTKRQREEDDNIRRLASDKNKELTAEDRAKNLEWLAVGRRGERRLIKAVPRGQRTQLGRGNMEDRWRMPEIDPPTQPPRPRLNSKRTREVSETDEGEEEMEGPSQPPQPGLAWETEETSSE